MKKLVLSLESLAVETFQVDGSPSLRGTVEGASYPSDGCPATMLLSGCASACMPSGIRQCFSPPPC